MAPLTTFERNKAVGNIRQENIAKVLDSWGYNTRSVSIEENEADLWVHQGRRTIALIEVLNWNRKGRLNDKRAAGIIANLIIISGNRFLVCSFPENVKSHLDILRENKIQVIYVGFQTLPVDIYDSEITSPKIAEIKGSKPQSSEILSILKERLASLKDLEDDPPMTWKEFIRRMRNRG